MVPPIRARHLRAKRHRRPETSRLEVAPESPPAIGCGLSESHPTLAYPYRKKTAAGLTESLVIKTGNTTPRLFVAHQQTSVLTPAASIPAARLPVAEGDLWPRGSTWRRKPATCAHWPRRQCGDLWKNLVLTPLQKRPVKPFLAPLLCSEGRAPTEGSGCDTDENDRNGGNATPIADYVVELPLEVWRSGRHVLLEFLHRDKFNAHVDLVAHVEGEMLHE